MATKTLNQCVVLSSIDFFKEACVQDSYNNNNLGKNYTSEQLCFTTKFLGTNTEKMT